MARTVRNVRLALGWSQRELAERADVSQATISRVENAALEDLTFATAALLLDALGVRVALDMRAPFIADGARQKDPGHARCVAYVARRLRRLGWATITEVEIVTGASHGWIDVLAYRQQDGLMLVIEVKTELVDIGQVERQLSWYERSAWDLARQQGWRPRQAIGVLLVLATELSIERIRVNREPLHQSLPMSAPALGRVIATEGEGPTANRAMALIDPLNRSKRWLLPTPLWGRVKPPRYANYAALMTRIRAA